MEQEYFMQQALALAREAAVHGEVPVGCVIVRNGEIVGRGRNQREEKQAAVSHAEMEAIAQANAALGSWRLDECDLYVTLEPCPMCAGAMVMAQLDGCVFGAYDARQGCCGSVYGSKVWHSNDKYRRTVWKCNARFVKGTGCQTPHLSEPMIEQKFLAAFNQLLAQRDFISDDMQAIIQQLTNTAELDAEKESLQVEMGIVSERIRQVVSQNASAALDQEEYTWNSL